MSGRIPRPWYRKGKDAWYVELHGRKVRLGTTKAEAFKRFYELQAGVEPIPTAESCRWAVETLVGLYLDDLRRRVSPRTLYVARCYLNPVLAACGRIIVRQLRRQHVEDAISKHAAWNSSTRYHVTCRIVAAFNWAVREGIIQTNPLQGIHKPLPRSRGTRVLITPDEYARLYDAAPEYLQHVLFALHETGCRPCEVLTVEAKDFDAELGVWVLERHKTAHETGRPRIVYLTPTLVELCKLLANRHPTGPLFRRRSGKPFPPAYYLARLVRQLRTKLGIKGAIPYSLRHGWATDALSAGVPDAHVAELLGHTGTAMLHRHYNHLVAKREVLRAAFNRVR
jgi:integrase